MGMKRRQELQADKDVLNKRKKELINEKKWLIQSYIWDIVLEFVCLDFNSLFFDLLLTILTIFQYFLVWVSGNLSLESWKWFNRKTSVIQF